jgi:hypothetical protein
LVIRLLTIGNTYLIAEEAYYWNYANHLDFSYLDHPPMVAFLIKIFTTLFGTNEFAIRLPGILCLGICAFYSYKLTELIKPEARLYSVVLLAVLPFFFIQSLVMTPDLPLIACWSACLYYLYIALTTDKKRTWYYAGVAFGIGLLSKYTIVLLLPAVLIHILFTKNAYKKLLTPQPYLAILIATCIFSPVIYWNSTHEWVSFLFQSTNRFNAETVFSFHEISGLLILFLTPLGILSFIQMFKHKYLSLNTIDIPTQRFLQIFTCTPLIFFSIFSLVHEVKFNWIGPGLIAVIPWIAIQISGHSKPGFYKRWLITSAILLTSYTGILLCITSSTPKVIHQALFSKFIDWNDFYQQINNIAGETTTEFNRPTMLVPIDKYNIASELSFYQAQSISLNKTSQTYKITSRNLFGENSLMYDYWYDKEPLTNKTLLLIGIEEYLFNQPHITRQVTALSPVKKLSAKYQGKNTLTTPYFYQIVSIKQ